MESGAKSQTTMTTTIEASHTETTPLAPTYNQSNSLDELHQSATGTIYPGYTSEEKLAYKYKQLVEIWMMCEGHRQMHRLAHTYYSYRHIRYNLVPITALTTASGIMAFLASSDIVPQADKQYLSLSVGILAIISTAIQTFNQESRYDSKAEMHKNAALGLKKITDSIAFVLYDPRTKKKIKEFQSDQENTEVPQGLESNETEIDNNFSSYMDLYQQILDSCQSQIPLKISQTFFMAQSRLELSLTKEDRAVLKNEYSYGGKQLIHQYLFEEVFCGISNYRGFPFCCPPPAEIVTEAMNAVEECFQKRQIRFSRTEDV